MLTCYLQAERTSAADFSELFLKWQSSDKLHISSYVNKKYFKYK